MSVLCEKRFRVELHPLDGKRAMPHAHDLPVLGFRGHFQTGRQACSANRERVVPGRVERGGQTSKHASPGMTDAGDLSVNDLPRAHELTPERLADRLMPQAHAEYRNLAGE